MIRPGYVQRGWTATESGYSISRLQRPRSRGSSGDCPGEVQLGVRLGAEALRFFGGTPIFALWRHRVMERPG